MSNAETQRLAEESRRQHNWKRWGPYLAERQWGTVREDYSADGDAWNYLPHDHARSCAYRWGEDGLLGWTDRQCRLCFGVALWNERDPILKERLYGLTNPQGNHGEDVKELYYYLDATPTYSYTQSLYKYPQAAFPYEQLSTVNAHRTFADREYELRDTGVFDDNRYFDVFAEYAKGSDNDTLIRLTIHNRGPEAAPLHVLPTVWFRNTWTWGCKHEGCWIKPRMTPKDNGVLCDHVSLGRFMFTFAGETPPLLFTENETNTRMLYGTDNYTPYVKDAFHRYVIEGDSKAINPKQVGTKVAGHYQMTLEAGAHVTLKMRLMQEDATLPQEPFSQIFDLRKREADAFYDQVNSDKLSSSQRNVARQSYASLLCSKQFYHYVVNDWLEGDPNMPAPPAERKAGRNTDWKHLFNRDLLSMPDKWEYPWPAAWDTAFHMIPMARIDPKFAKRQLTLFLREWYMHPNGQIPAYEFALDDVNPPVHAWACWRVYKMTGPRGQRDRLFLSRCFQKLLINFTWWVNRKDVDGRNIFAGGFLGLDNIGVFDRSAPLPGGHRLDQADATAWMAFYCLTMLSMALELASEGDRAYEDMASKFFEHFVQIADAMNTLGGSGLWDEQDGFYYDQLIADGECHPMRVRSMVGLIPLIAVEVLEHDVIEKLPSFKKRMDWFLTYRQDLAKHITYMDRADTDGHKHYLLAIPKRDRLERVLQYLLSEDEFLSPYGIRSLSRFHAEHPFRMDIGGQVHEVAYTPSESTSGMFGGNSNWRGPVWFPINFLLIEALERYHHYYGDSLKVKCPLQGGRSMTLREVSVELSRRLTGLFVPDETGKRPAHGDDTRYADDPHFRDLVLFYEYFHGDSGRGCGASHQTGWTALISRCLDKCADAAGD